MHRQALVHQQDCEDARGCGQAASIRDELRHRIVVGWSRRWGDLRVPRRAQELQQHGSLSRGDTC
jgi:hypothetical protein